MYVGGMLVGGVTVAVAGSVISPRDGSGVGGEYSASEPTGCVDCEQPNNAATSAIIKIANAVSNAWRGMLPVCCGGIWCGEGNRTSRASEGYSS